MGNFTRRPLELLDGIYRFVGGLRGVRGVDLGSDITLVHDVGRQAERNGIGGYYGRVEWQDTLTANGVLEEIVFRTTIQPLLGETDEHYELYILRCWVNCSTTDLADITAFSFHHGDDSSSGAGIPRYAILVGTAQTPYDLIVSAAQADFGNVSTSTGTQKKGFGYTPPAPVRTKPGGFIAVTAETTASAAFDFGMELWAGPPGSTPPGLS